MPKLSENQLTLLLKFICAWMFSFSALSAIISLTILQTNMISMVFLAAFFTAAFFLALHNKYTVLIFALASAFAALYIYSLLSAEKVNPETAVIVNHLYGTWCFARGLIEYAEPYNITVLRLLAAIISFVCVLLIKLRYSYLALFALGTGVFITANLETQIGFQPTYIIMLLSLYMLYINRTNEAGGYLSAVKALPLCILALAISMALPMPDTRLSREFFQNAYEEAYWFVREPFMPKYFSSGAIGFENSKGELGGDLRFSKDFIMYVFADEPVYLSGVTKDIYTGTSWISGFEAEFTPTENVNILGNNPFDVLWRAQTEYNAYNERSKYVMGIEQKNITINVGKARTGTVFKPDKVTNLTIHGAYGLTSKGLDLRCEPVFQKDAIYYSDYYKFDYENIFIKKMLLSSKRGYYKEAALNLRQTVGELTPTFGILVHLLSIVNYYENELIPYANSVYESHTLLPETLPQRVYELAEQITASYETDYEKVEAIKNYLRSKKYSLTPGNLPEERDFVDYFLFDVNEGYCTYYATAMAVMARVIGLPSRYNEGYILPDEKVDDSYYEVYGTNAHAWAEVYFEGVGWVPIEATPSSFFETYYPQADGYYDDYANSDENTDIFDRLDASAYGQVDGEIEAAEAFSNETLEEDTSGKGIYVVFGLAFLCFVYVLFRKTEENSRHKAMRFGQPNQAAIEAFKGILDLHSLLGIPIESHEPALMYARRIGKYSPLGGVSMNSAAEIFSKAKFGRKEITDTEASMLRKSYFFLYRQLEAGDLKYKFLIHRYIKKLT